MTIHSHSKPAKHSEQGPHTHGHSDGHGPLRLVMHGPVHMNGVKRMQMLGRLNSHIPFHQDWLSNYRSRRVLPFNNTAYLIALVLVLVGVAIYALTPTTFGWLLLMASAVPLIGLLGIGLYITHGLRTAQAQDRATILAAVPWRGTEQVLDVGCGTGLILNAVARNLTSGKATGIDLWEEEVGGSREVLMRNAQAEGVADKVALQAMDARQLTFPDASFDVVMSSFALHHIMSRQEDIAACVMHIGRVLKPGGYVVLVDIGPMIDLAEASMPAAGLQVAAHAESASFRCVTARKP